MRGDGSLFHYWFIEVSGTLDSIYHAWFMEANEINGTIDNLFHCWLMESNATVNSLFHCFMKVDSTVDNVYGTVDIWLLVILILI